MDCPETSGHLTGQGAVGSSVLEFVVAGPGCGFSEEPMSGVRSVALECRVVPECPPGPARFASFLVGEHAGVDDVGQASFECAHGHHRGHARRLCVRRSRRGLRLGWRSWTTAMMCRARLIRRLPARESRCRCCSPEDASSGAVPFQDANRSRSAKRWMSPTSASSRAAPDGPMPCRSSSVEPRAVDQLGEFLLHRL